MRLNYKQRLFIYFALIFGVFTTVVIVFEQHSEKKFKTEALEEKLDAYAEIVNAALASSGDVRQELDSLIRLLPQNIRLSLIESDGTVAYDNSVADLHGLQNHALRPEIAAAAQNNRGTDIRLSTSTQMEYLYYARKFGNYYVRVALPYDIQVQRFLKTDNLFIYFILIFFAIMLALINRVTGRFAESIGQLRDFVLSPESGRADNYVFPDDELGEIGTKITESYRQLKESKTEVDTQRERLLQHVYSSEEGVCFFTPDTEVEFYNGLFIQYLNVLTDEANSEPGAIFTDPVFNKIARFLSEADGSYFETLLEKQGKVFSSRVNIFDNGGFELILNDVTKREKTRRLKQEMTGNIAHELRTPVTSIRGYLETVLDRQLDEDQRQRFINQAYNQTVVLSELIHDMGLITKIEESPQSFRMEEVDVVQLLEELKDTFYAQMNAKSIRISWSIPDGTKTRGNRNLLYSVFRNLIDNVIRHAGGGVMIHVSMYKEDDELQYFSFYDTGCGIADEKHLDRLFERFYRITEGRTRDTGGSGLGLSIVRNAIAFHRGAITAKNRKEGGLEFLFQLHK